MITKIFIYLFIFFGILTYNSHASEFPVVYPDNTDFGCCGDGYYQTSSAYVRDNFVHPTLQNTCDKFNDLIYSYHHVTADYNRADGWNPTQEYSVACVAVPECILPLINNPDDLSQCIDAPPLREVCPPDSNTYDATPEAEIATCVCNSPYIASYDLFGMTCTLPTCDPEVNGLPLFATVTDITECNFYPMSDSLALTHDGGFTCCYGQSNDDGNSSDYGCPPNHIAIGSGDCVEIERPADAPDYTCFDGQYYDFLQGGCKNKPDDLIESNPNNLPDGSAGSGQGDGTVETAPNPDGSCDVGYQINPISGQCALILPDGLPTDGSGQIGDGDGDGSDDGFDGLLSGVSESLMGVLNGYVLLHVPISATGTCSSELKYTFNILGTSYILDASPWIAELDPMLPIIKGLIVMAFAFAGVILVMAGGV